MSRLLTRLCDLIWTCLLAIIGGVADAEQIAARLRSRAEEVAFSEWTSSNFVTVNEDSYQVWKANDWWMVPWMDKLSPGISL